MRHEDDADLAQRALTGGAEAFSAIVDRYQDAIFAVALVRLRNFHDAEDAAQSVFVRAFEQLGSLKDGSRLGAWLRTIAIHESLNRLKARRETVSIESVEEKATSGEGSGKDRSELREQVLAAIGRLSKTQRETTTLFYINGYSVDEVAAIQEVPAGTVKRRLHDAREKLKEEMIGVVENVLKSEAPKEDLAERVFKIVSQRERLPVNPDDGARIFRELRQVGAEGDVDGFAKAFESPHAETRRLAVSFAVSFHALEGREKLADLIQRAIRDPNQAVRGAARRAALQLAASSDEKRKMFLPLVVELLSDPAKMVRWCTARELQVGGWVADVPLETAARTFLEETNRSVRQAKEDLLRAVLDAGTPGAETGTGPDNVDEWLNRAKEDLRSPSSRVRYRGINELFELLGYCTGTSLMSANRPRVRLSDRRRRQEVVGLLAGMLTDPARRHRWRVAWQLLPWAGDVPIQVVEKALRAEINPRVRPDMEKLLRKAKEEQKRK